MCVRWRNAMALALLLAACGSPDDDTDVAGTDIDTMSESDSDTETVSDTDTETADVSQCQTCVESSYSAIASCMNPCVNLETFCDQQMCRFDCEVDGVHQRVQCLDGFAECSDASVLAECEGSCRDTWSACTSGSVCPQGSTGRCQDDLFACLDTCI